MADDRLREAIKAQADDLKKRVEWLQNMIERQNQVILNAQETVGHFRHDLTAAKMALDGLRADYQKLMRNGSNNSKE